MKKYFCDNCKKLIENDKKCYELTTYLKNIENGTYDNSIRTKKHFCKSCKNKLVDLFNKQF